MIRFAHTLSDEETTYSRPMPVAALPVGPARARRLRLLQLREALADPVDVDAVASAITRRALFTQELAERLAQEARDESLAARSKTA